MTEYAYANKKLLVQLNKKHFHDIVFSSESPDDNATKNSFRNLRYLRYIIVN